ncbi:MAG: LuxR C-terminal-related transcriptional regulator [Tepidimonas sp.]|uniref:LuxR C-terminal-related transcriptional regulator n=1 Tax=Tepidimonas sp. TaxID=2002775 RepID=UPI004054A0CA
MAATLSRLHSIPSRRGTQARERGQMYHVAAGKLNKAIAEEMHISVRTVEVHRLRVFVKLGVRSAAELATLLARTGL